MGTKQCEGKPGGKSSGKGDPLSLCVNRHKSLTHPWNGHLTLEMYGIDLTKHKQIFENRAGIGTITHRRWYRTCLNPTVLNMG